MLMRKPQINSTLYDPSQFLVTADAGDEGGLS